jgi:hypothetical protein
MFRLHRGEASGKQCATVCDAMRAGVDTVAMAAGLWRGVCFFWQLCQARRRLKAELYEASYFFTVPTTGYLFLNFVSQSLRMSFSIRLRPT